MTNDYKEMLLKYLLGNPTRNFGNNTPQFNDYQNINNSLITQIRLLTESDVFNVIKVIQLKDSNDLGLNSQLILVNYPQEIIQKSMFIVVDNEFNYIARIKEFKSGTDFGLFTNINIDENGNLYGIDNLGDTQSGRVVLMTNIGMNSLNGKWEVAIRKTYNLIDSYFTYNSNLAEINTITKELNTSTYLITSNVSVYANNTYPIFIEYSINVGSENEYEVYTYGVINDYFNYKKDVVFQEIDSKVYFKVIAKGGLSGGFDMFYNVADSNILSISNLNTGLEAIELENSSVAYSMGFYYEENGFLKWYKTDLLTNEKTTIKSINLDENNIEILKTGMFKTNGEVFYYYSYKEPTSDPAYNIYLKVGRIVGNNVYEDSYNDIFIRHSIADPDEYYLFSISKNFNLYNYNLQVNNECFNFTQIYDSEIYNGLPYENINSLIPRTSRLYDSNDTLIFARNLYNTITSYNINTSVVSIPNSQLNNTLISIQELWGETNKKIIENNVSFTKNIYEQLYINFINTLNVIDNNGATPVLNPTGASRINDSISQTMDYDDTKIGKYKINYANDTSVINPINTDLTFTELSTNYIITVYVPIDYGITSIQLLSNDETTVYQTIDCSNLENNKYYTINQKMEVI